MDNLKTVSELVKLILERNPECRNSDNLLYCQVIQTIESRLDFRITQMPVQWFLQNMNHYGCPKFETVRRARQKVQADNPHLRACESVEAARMHNESVVRAWAREQ